MKQFLRLLALIACYSSFLSAHAADPVPPLIGPPTPTDAGFLDAGFGVGGKAEMSLPGCDAGATAVGIQQDGKIVTAGFCNKGASDADFVVARFNVDGTLDADKTLTLPDMGIYRGIGFLARKKSSSVKRTFHYRGFSEDGIATTNFTDGASNRFEQATAIAVQADQKIIVAGQSQALPHSPLCLTHDDGSEYCADGKACSHHRCVDPGALPKTQDFALVRYNTDGTIDTTFNGGQVVTDFGYGDDWLADVTVLSSGQIVAVGSSESGEENGERYWSRCSIVRYNADGSENLRFSTSEIPACQYVQAVASLPDGDILVTGRTISTQGAFVARFHSDGHKASNFGAPNGIVLLPADWIHGDWAGDLDVEVTGSTMGEPEGRIVVAGFHRASSDYDTDYFLARLDLKTGALDTSFGSDGTGIVRTDFTPGDGAGRLVRQADGKYVVAGWHAYEPQGVGGRGLLKDNFVLARYDASGRPDATFGTEVNGRMWTKFACGRAVAKDLAVDASGRIVAVGFCENIDVDPSSKAVAVMARYSPQVMMPLAFPVDTAAERVKLPSVRGEGSVK
jgi:uncharacterized delta-60 repeat protein